MSLETQPQSSQPRSLNLASRAAGRSPVTVVRNRYLIERELDARSELGNFDKPSPSRLVMMKGARGVLEDSMQLIVSKFRLAGEFTVQKLSASSSLGDTC